MDLLKHCGIHSYKQGARHIHFNGVEKELPQGDNGSYGTSLIYGTAMNPANDILIAYKHNGKLLAPDHGFPVRVIIPGGIGGRMVKWLANIEVLATESENFYHQHDNKVLPAGIEMDQANKEGESYSPKLPPVMRKPAPYAVTSMKALHVLYHESPTSMPFCRAFRRSTFLNVNLSAAAQIVLQQSALMRLTCNSPAQVAL